MPKALRHLVRDDKLYCPRCFESGTAAVELDLIRAARRPGGFPYLLTRRHRCPSCGATFVSAERLGLAALKRALEKASSAPEDSAVESEHAGQQDDPNGQQEGEERGHRES